MVNKDPRQIRRMFASIAPRYDLLNHLLSLSIDRLWRRKTARLLQQRLPPNPDILDVCSGTGDLAFSLSRVGAVVACDFCHPMLIQAAKKSRGTLPLIEGDALRLPIRPGTFDAVTIAFGLRNLVDFQAGIQEMHRLLRPGGYLAVLEFSVPTLPGYRQFYLFYFTQILPRIGALVSGRDGPYSYLPESVREFPEPPELAKQMKALGFVEVETWSLTGGVATLYLAKK